jgi:hypothetical protein
MDETGENGDSREIAVVLVLYYKPVKSCFSDTIFWGTGDNRENGAGWIDGRDSTLFPLFSPVPGLVAAEGRAKSSC